MARKSKHNRSEANKAAKFLRPKIVKSPRVGILTGTGLGDIAIPDQAETTIEYKEIPHFPVSTVTSHPGKLVSGIVADQSVVVLQGRCHLYEGYSPLAVTFPIRVLQALGVETLILTNASGGLNPAFSTGQIMVIDDQINLTGANPLEGPNDDKWGPRFPDMSAGYDKQLQTLAQSAARQDGFSNQIGVYAGLRGPSLETPAEMRYLRAIGADAVGFSTVMETIAAVHAGMQVLGLSIITNMCLPEAPMVADVEEILDVARSATPQVETTILHVLEQLDTAPALESYWT